MANEKTQLQYSVIQIQAGEKTYRYPKLTNVRMLNEDKAIELAIESGDLKGKYDELKATINGFNRFIYKKQLEGYFITTEFFKAYMTLNGQVGEDGLLTSENTLHTKYLPLKESKVDRNDYSFQYVGETAKCYITSVCSTSGSASGQLRYGDDIYATGTNLYFNAEDGDTIVLTRADGTTVNMSCGAWSALVLNIPWAEDIKETDIGTDVTLTFTLHGGDKTLTPKVITKKVKLIAAE